MKHCYPVVEGPFWDKGVRIQGVYLSKVAATHEVTLLGKGYVHESIPVDDALQRVLLVFKKTAEHEGVNVVEETLDANTVDYAALEQRLDESLYTWGVYVLHE